jgi:hypothetical protein
VRVEGHRDDVLDTDVVGDLTGAADHVLVTEVDPVEVADGDRGAAEVVGHLVERAPDPHDACAPVHCPGRDCDDGKRLPHRAAGRDRGRRHPRVSRNGTVPGEIWCGCN